MRVSTHVYVSPLLWWLLRSSYDFVEIVGHLYHLQMSTWTESNSSCVSQELTRLLLVYACVNVCMRQRF